MAKTAQLYYNSHVDRQKSSILEDFAAFLPYPHYTKPDTLNLGVSKQTAREIIRDWETMPIAMKILMEPHALELQYLADF